MIRRAQFDSGIFVGLHVQRLSWLYKPFLTAEIVRLFWSNVNVGGDGCWEWKVLYEFSRPSVRLTPWLHEPAARVAYVISRWRDIPCGLLVCHHCDNPQCVRPSHLFLGTQKDNMRDMWSKGRQYGGPNQPNRKSGTPVRVARGGAA